MSEPSGKKDAEFGIRMRADLLDRLRALKERKDRSVAWLIERCIEAHLPAMEAEEGIMHDAPGKTAPPPPAKNHGVRYRRKPKTP